MTRQEEVRESAAILLDTLADAQRLLDGLRPMLDQVRRWPGTVESGALADVLDLADQLKRAAVDVRHELAHVALIRCQAAWETKAIMSPTGLVGWIAEGSGQAAYVRRMYRSELEEMQS